MRKALSVLLAATILVTLAACKNDKKNDDASADSQLPVTSALPNATDSQTPAAPQGNETEPLHSAVFDGDLPLMDFGYEPSEDPFSRLAYDFAYIVTMHEPLTQLMTDIYADIGKKLNFTITSYSSYRNTDIFVSLIEDKAEKAVDAMIIDGDIYVQDRILETTDELGIVYMPGSSPLIAQDGKYLMPSAVMDSSKMGEECAGYMLDFYEQHTGAALEAAKTGFITIGYDANSDYRTRRNGAAGAFRTRFPAYYSSNYFALDTAGEQSLATSEAAYNCVEALVAENPQFESWLIFGVADVFADGASRAIDDAGLGNVSLVTCVGMDLLGKRWDSGYDGCWVAAAVTPPVQQAHAVISGLLLLLESNATAESLWLRHRSYGQNYAVIKLPFSIVHKEVYSDYLAAVDRYTEGLFS